MSGNLCAYCRGVSTPDGTHVEHGIARFADRCSCDCHADQVVEVATFEIRLDVTLDLVAAFLMFAEEHGITQETLDADVDDYDLDHFLTWASETIEVETDASDIAGILTYREDIEQVDLALDKVKAANLLRVVYPKLPQATRGSAPEAQVPGQMTFEEGS
jgi:hypothetical protein